MSLMEYIHGAVSFWCFYLVWRKRAMFSLGIVFFSKQFQETIPKFLTENQKANKMLVIGKLSLWRCPAEGGRAFPGLASASLQGWADLTRAICVCSLMINKYYKWTHRGASEPQLLYEERKCYNAKWPYSAVVSRAWEGREGRDAGKCPMPGTNQTKTVAAATMTWEVFNDIKCYLSLFDCYIYVYNLKEKQKGKVANACYGWWVGSF